MAGNMKSPVVFLFALVGFSQGADFFTGMDRHIGCFYDKPSDRYWKNLPFIPKISFLNPMPQGLSSSGPTDRATDDQRVFQGMCRDVLQVCRDAGIVSNFSAMT